MLSPAETVVTTTSVQNVVTDRSPQRVIASTAKQPIPSCPAVQEVAVVGMKDEKWGESPHAFVVLRAGTTASEDELKQFVRDRLAHFKAPQWVTIVDDLPKTATGKVQKYVLRSGGSSTR